MPFGGISGVTTQYDINDSFLLATRASNLCVKFRVLLAQNNINTISDGRMYY